MPYSLQAAYWGISLFRGVILVIRDTTSRKSGNHPDPQDYDILEKFKMQ